MLKSDLRRQMRQIKRQFTPQQLGELSLPVIARLEPYVVKAHTVLAYYSLPDEVCTHQLLDRLVVHDKIVLLPKVLSDETMELRRYTGVHDLREGSYHIMEPVGELFADLQQIDVALIPGMAFDAQGHRLGRGKGYYDRLLVGMCCKTIGICFDFQKVPEVPVDSTDIAVNLVL